MQVFLINERISFNWTQSMLFCGLKSKTMDEQQVLLHNTTEYIFGFYVKRFHFVTICIYLFYCEVNLEKSKVDKTKVIPA